MNPDRAPAVDTGGAGPAGIDRDTAGLGLAQAVAARLCHDISGLLGTLLGTIEMAQDTPAGATESLELGAETARELVGRLRLLRAAWGGGAGELDAQGCAELLSCASGRQRVRTDWSGVAPGRFDAIRSCLLLNIALTGLESLPGGGTVRVAGGPGQDVIVTLEGPRAAWPPGWLSAVAARRSLPPPTTRTLQPAFTLLLAHQDETRLSVLMAGGDGPPALLIHA